MESAQPSLFDPPEAERRKRDGMDKAASRSGTWLELARATARRIAQQRGTVTADDVREALFPEYAPPSTNAMGSIFRSRDFEWTGEWRASRVPQGHGNLQRVWRVRG